MILSPIPLLLGPPPGFLFSQLEYCQFPYMLSPMDDVLLLFENLSMRELYYLYTLLSLSEELLTCSLHGVGTTRVQCCIKGKKPTPLELDIFLSLDIKFLQTDRQFQVHPTLANSALNQVPGCVSHSARNNNNKKVHK